MNITQVLSFLALQIAETTAERDEARAEADQLRGRVEQLAEAVERLSAVDRPTR